jgi:hypothetical protein
MVLSPMTSCHRTPTKKNYRPKRSDKFNGPEGSLFDIAGRAWIGAAAVKQVAE